MQGWTVTQGMDSQEKEEENYKKDIEKLLRKSSKKTPFRSLIKEKNYASKKF